MKSSTEFGEICRKGLTHLLRLRAIVLSILVLSSKPRSEGLTCFEEENNGHGLMIDDGRISCTYIKETAYPREGPAISDYSRLPPAHTLSLDLCIFCSTHPNPFQLVPTNLPSTRPSPVGHPFHLCFSTSPTSTVLTLSLPCPCSISIIPTSYHQIYCQPIHLLLGTRSIIAFPPSPHPPS